jgi:hypothetical protein
MPPFQESVNRFMSSSLPVGGGGVAAGFCTAGLYLLWADPLAACAFGTLAAVALLTAIGSVYWPAAQTASGGRAIPDGLLSDAVAAVMDLEGLTGTVGPAKTIRAAAALIRKLRADAALPAEVVTYRRLKSFGNYENEAVELSVPVLPGQTRDEAFAGAMRWVGERVNAEGEAAMDGLDADIDAKRRELAEIDAQLKRAREHLDRAKNSLDDIPF